MGVYVDTSQVEHLAADFVKAPAGVDVKISRVVRKVAHDVERDAKILCPVDTGFLKNSIGVDVDAFSAVIGPTASYGHYVEFGTSRMSPEPYMRPAASRNEESFVQALAQIAGSIL